jgi:hypothetical protein
MPSRPAVLAGHGPVPEASNFADRRGHQPEEIQEPGGRAPQDAPQDEDQAGRDQCAGAREMMVHCPAIDFYWLRCNTACPAFTDGCVSSSKRWLQLSTALKSVKSCQVCC